MRSAFTGAFAPYICGLIEKKQALGYDYHGSACILRTFDEFCREQFPNETCLTAELAMKWAEQFKTEKNLSRLNRVSVIRELAKYMNSVGEQAYLLPLQLTKKSGRHMYEAAVSLKTARQRNTCEKENDAIDLLRDFVRCDNCGQPMKRRVSMKHRIRESWNCTNDDCGIRVRISDTQLIETITVLINRVILNDHLLQPKPRKRYEPDAKVTKVGNDIALELERDAPNEEYIIEKTIEMAALMYEQSNAKLNLTVSLARKLAHTMVTQDEFNRDYFTALASYITLGEQGRVVLHTKTETEVTLDDGSNESP